MIIRILQLIEGAKKAVGLTVIIDVFRAFSTACYVFVNGAKKIIPVGDIDVAYRLKKENPHYILMGERGGKIQPGFDYGNSPTVIENVDFTDRTIIQTTSAGTQGIANSIHADEIITGSFVNAGAVVSYIRSRKPEHVSLVSMGTAGVESSDEDTLFAQYVKSALLDEQNNFHCIYKQIRQSKSAQKFFNPKIEWALERDFELCLSLDRFDFVLKVIQDFKNLTYMQKINI
jgi:2-phosphosulfolactate phosphatase